MSSLLEPRYTPQQYLEMERQASFKSEYLAGEIFPMGGEILALAGPSEAHNLAGDHRGLRPCRVPAVIPAQGDMSL